MRAADDFGCLLPVVLVLSIIYSRLDPNQFLLYISALRRGFTPTALRDFCERIGVTRSDGIVDVGVLEFCVRDDLDKNAPRAMCVLKPLKVTLTNYPAEQVETLTAHNHPNRDDLGDRAIPFTQTVFIEQEDFREEANKKYKRMVTGGEVRLRGAYVVRADEVIKDDAGNIVELICSYDPETLCVNPADGRKVRGVIHWVEASQAVPAEFRIYDRLFTVPNPAAEEDFLAVINPASLTVKTGWVEPSLKTAEAEKAFQFEREGYYCADNKDSTPDHLVFNRTVALRDTFFED